MRTDLESIVKNNGLDERYFTDTQFKTTIKLLNKFLDMLEIVLETYDPHTKDRILNDVINKIDKDFKKTKDVEYLIQRYL